jgi:hypothetical protein
MPRSPHRDVRRFRGDHNRERAPVPDRRAAANRAGDLRGFAAFAETAEPEEVLRVLRQYHEAVGEVVMSQQGTIEHFAGDGLMVFFNDPTPAVDHELAAVRTAMTCAIGSGCSHGSGVTWARARARHRDRHGLRDIGPGRVRGPLRVRRGRERHHPRLAAQRRGRSARDLARPASTCRGRGARRDGAGAGASAQGPEPAGRSRPRPSNSGLRPTSTSSPPTLWASCT